MGDNKYGESFRTSYHGEEYDSSNECRYLSHTPRSTVRKYPYNLNVEILDAHRYAGRVHLEGNRYLLVHRCFVSDAERRGDEGQFNLFLMTYVPCLNVTNLNNSLRETGISTLVIVVP